MLIEKDLEPRTLGESDYDLDAPLQLIRRLMMESSGIIGIALGSNFDKQMGFTRLMQTEGITPQQIEEKRITSPFCQIEPANGFSIRAPITLLRKGRN